MHEYTTSSPRGTIAGGQQPNQIERQVSDEAATRPHNERIPSGSSVDSVLPADIDSVPTTSSPPAPDAASDTSRQPSFSDRTGSTVGPPPTSPPGRWLGLKHTWRIPATILGFYFIAFLCVVAHYCFFAYLDGRIISPGFMLSAETTTVPQAYATTVSFVLVIAFRAALVASIGTCYTQYLWATFRKRALKISLIEDHFQVQTNPFHFFNYQLYFRTPVLVAIAIFCWLVPIATFYPPGTLVVGIRPASIEKSFNVSVLHHRDLLDIAQNNIIAHISCHSKCIDYSCLVGPPQFPEAAENVTYLETCHPSDMAVGMEYITRSNLIVGEISRLKPPSKENTSYGLSFFGTTLECETTNSSMESTILQLNYLGGWMVHYPEPDCTLKNSIWSLPTSVFDEYVGDDSITYRLAHYKYGEDVAQYWPCLDTEFTLGDPPSYLDDGVDLPGAGIHVIIPTTETVCRPKIVKHHVNITHAGGAQHVSHTIEEDIYIPPYTPRFDGFNGSFEQWAQLSDALMIYRDFARNLNQSGINFIRSDFIDNSMSNETTPHTNENGTVVETCVLKVDTMQVGVDGWTPFVKPPPTEIWPISVFEQRLHEGDKLYQCPAFDLDMANELLINTTISALALNQRFDTVNGTETLNFNAYRFENKLAFFLPYGLSLVLAIPILVLGFVALYAQNHGVSAISGGFLQLLMTTTGRTSLEAMVTRGSGTLGGYENVSKELREMEVRFGELIEVSGNDLKETDTLLSRHEGRTDVREDDSSQSGFQTMSKTERCENSVSAMRRAGFGTVHDVEPFGKKGE